MFKIYEYAEKYFFIGSFGDMLDDRDIVKILNIDYNLYKDVLLNEFNGYSKKEYNNEIFFKNRKKAMEWIESVYITIKLNKGEK